MGESNTLEREAVAAAALRAQAESVPAPPRPSRRVARQESPGPPGVSGMHPAADSGSNAERSVASSLPPRVSSLGRAAAVPPSSGVRTGAVAGQPPSAPPRAEERAARPPPLVRRQRPSAPPPVPRQRPSAPPRSASPASAASRRARPSEPPPSTDDWPALRAERASRGPVSAASHSAAAPSALLPGAGSRVAGAGPYEPFVEDSDDSTPFDPRIELGAWEPPGEDSVSLAAESLDPRLFGEDEEDAADTLADAAPPASEPGAVHGSRAALDEEEGWAGELRSPGSPRAGLHLPGVRPFSDRSGGAPSSPSVEPPPGRSSAVPPPPERPAPDPWSPARGVPQARLEPPPWALAARADSPPIPLVSLAAATGSVANEHVRRAVSSRKGASTGGPEGELSASWSGVGFGVSPSSSLFQRLGDDLRSSKREIAVGLGIGLALSALLVVFGRPLLRERGLLPGESASARVSVGPGELGSGAAERGESAAGHRSSGAAAAASPGSAPRRRLAQGPTRRESAPELEALPSTGPQSFRAGEPAASGARAPGPQAPAGGSRQSASDEVERPPPAAGGRAKSHRVSASPDRAPGRHEVAQPERPSPRGQASASPERQKSAERPRPPERAVESQTPSGKAAPRGPSVGEVAGLEEALPF